MDITACIALLHQAYQTHQTEITNFITIFILNAIGTTLSNLRTVFLSRQITKPVYFTTFVDALIFAYAINLFVAAPGILFIIGFAGGKIFGVYLGGKIDARLALGIIEVSIYKHLKDGIALADHLRNMGYSVTTLKGYGIKGKERLIIQVVIPRKYLSELKQELHSRKESVNLSIKSITKTYGKVGQVM
ncbi:MAG: DUF2179 domain-containing protein [Syntrophomonadaceae bacterium]